MKTASLISIMILLAPAQTRNSGDSRPVILAFGDSLTAGYGVTPDAAYPARLQRRLDERGYKYRVVGMGISGDTTSSGRARLRPAIEQKPSIVILELGANDGLRGSSVPQIQANLENMIKEFQKAGAKVVLAGMTLPRNYGEAYVKSFEDSLSRSCPEIRLASDSFFSGRRCRKSEVNAGGSASTPMPRAMFA